MSIAQHIRSITAILKYGDFKSAKTIFMDKDISEEMVDRYFKEFKSLKDRITDLNKKNIDWWAKHPFEDFAEFIDNLQQIPSKNVEKKLKKMEGAEFIIENKDWRVYQITTHEAAKLYGSGTKWCITQATSNHFDDYIKENNFYFIISKNRPDTDHWYKICLQVDTRIERTYWDATDKNFREIPEDELNIPDFKVEKAQYRIQINKDGKDTLISIKEFQESVHATIQGDLDLPNIKMLPDYLTVDGELDLSNNPYIDELPDNLIVTGILDIRVTGITHLPSTLKAMSIECDDSDISSIPDNFKVEGYLSLNQCTKLEKLPKNLSTGGDLYLHGTSIKELPEDLDVGGYIYVTRWAQAQINIPEKFKDSIRN
jgi:hypothetical protein